MCIASTYIIIQPMLEKKKKIRSLTAYTIYTQSVVSRWELLWVAPRKKKKTNNLREISFLKNLKKCKKNKFF